MKSLMLCAFGAALALSVPAYAQSGTSQGSHSGSASSSSAKSSSDTKAMNQERLKKTLTEAGFQHVRILDESFLVQAQTKDGDPVIMLLNPPGPSTASASGQSSSGSGSSQGGSSQGSSSQGGSSGSGSGSGGMQK